MKAVTVNRSELLNILHRNRAHHREMFLRAQDIYRAKVIEELDRMLEDARNGSKIRRAVQLPEPEDHTADYDVVIEMLKMEVADVVTIDQGSFRQYVKDEWGWQQSFMSNTMSYLADE